jgi:hypothetical protein
MYIYKIPTNFIDMRELIGFTAARKMPEKRKYSNQPRISIYILHHSYRQGKEVEGTIRTKKRQTRILENN